MGEALVGCPFPDFSMEIVGNHPSQGNGEHMRLTDLTSNGRPTLLQFYACKRSNPAARRNSEQTPHIYTRTRTRTKPLPHDVLSHTRRKYGTPPPAPHMYSASDASSSGVRQSGTPFPFSSL